AGVELVRKLQFAKGEAEEGKRTEVLGLSTALLLDKNGKKFGKSEGNAVWIDENMLSSYEYFQFFRNVNDVEVSKLLLVYTDLSLEEISKIMQGDINEAKKILAFEATKLCHGEKNAKEVSKQSQEIFENKSNDNLPKLEYKNDEKLLFQVLKNLELAESFGEAKKLIRGGGIKINDEKAEDENLDISKLSNFKLSVGKKKHFLISLV
nr:tyrosine--tRNA ligase [Rickettsiales bacterium]